MQEIVVLRWSTGSFGRVGIATCLGVVECILFLLSNSNHSKVSTAPEGDLFQCGTTSVCGMVLKSYLSCILCMYVCMYAYTKKCVLACKRATLNLAIRSSASSHLPDTLCEHTDPIPLRCLTPLRPPSHTQTETRKHIHFNIRTHTHTHTRVHTRCMNVVCMCVGIL